MTKTVLHIHQDYPDVFNYPYTKAVSNLLDEMKIVYPEYQHYVISINRTANPFKIKFKKFKDGMAFVYWGVPINFLHVFTLWIASLFIRFVIRNIQYDVVHAHKLTTEGVIGSYLAQNKSCPYLISVRGGSDIRNLNRFGSHKLKFQQIYKNAAEVFWVSPWARREIEETLNYSLSSVKIFPNICKIDLNANINKRVAVNRFTFITVINYLQYRRKGILQLISAIAGIRQSGYDVELKVYGSGPENILSKLIKHANKLEISHAVHFCGQISQEELRYQMQMAAAMLLPSKNETFGMSFIEALSVRCPIMYMANTGIDGFFDQYNVGVRVTSQDPEDLKKGIIELIIEQDLKSAGIEKVFADKYLNNFLPEKIVEDYKNVLGRVLK